MPVVIKQLSPEDKEKMMAAARQIIDSLNTTLGANAFLSLQALNFVTASLEKQYAVSKIRTVDNKGKVDIKDKINRVRSVVEGMEESDINIVVFKDSDEVWYQYYLGKFLDKITLILAEESDREALLGVQLGPRCKIGYTKDRTPEALNATLQELLKSIK